MVSGGISRGRYLLAAELLLGVQVVEVPRQ